MYVSNFKKKFKGTSNSLDELNFLNFDSHSVSFIFGHLRGEERGWEVDLGE